MKYSYGKYINTFSFYVTVIQYKSYFNVCSVTYKHQNLQICSSVLLNKKKKFMWSGSINLRFFHNPLPLLKTNLHHLFYNAALGFLTGQPWNIFQLLSMKIFYLPTPLPQNFAFCAVNLF